MATKLPALSSRLRVKVRAVSGASGLLGFLEIYEHIGAGKDILSNFGVTVPTWIWAVIFLISALALVLSWIAPASDESGRNVGAEDRSQAAQTHGENSPINQFMAGGNQFINTGPIAKPQPDTLQVKAMGIVTHAGPPPPEPRQWLTIIVSLQIKNPDVQFRNYTTNWKMFLGNGAGIQGIRSTRPPQLGFHHDPNPQYIGDRTIEPATHIDGIVWAQFLPAPSDVSGQPLRVEGEDIRGRQCGVTVEMPNDRA